MKTFQIEDAKTRFFKSKEDYLNFKQAWKDFHNSDKLRWYKDVDVTFWDAPATQERVFARKKFTSLNSSHYMLYNLLRGYNSSRGFAPLVNKGRLNASGGLPWANCEEAISYIIRTARRLKEINSASSSSRRYAREANDALLLPFSGTVTNQMLYDLAAELYLSMTEQEFPPFEVEEYKDFTEEEEAKNKLSIAERIQSWRAA